MQAAQQIPAEEASRLLQLAAATACSKEDDRRIERMVQCLPEVQPLQLQELLAAAVQGSCSSAAARLLEVPAAQLLSASAVEVLLDAAVAVQSVAAAEMLCRTLSAARDIAPPAAGRLLKSALASKTLDSCEVAHGELEV
jgi:hypothetical protein